MLLRSINALLLIGFSVWAVYSWSGYAERHAQANDGWRQGGTHQIEITVVRDDVDNLACASDVEVNGLRCGYPARPRPPGSPVPPERLLRPYNTVKGELFLGQGMWDALGPWGALPPQRFTVVCDFHMMGVIKSVWIRWAREGGFDPADKSVPAGTLSNCVIPQ